MTYDVYYTTGGGDFTYCGADVWVNWWLERIPQNLDVKPILLIHRTKPDWETGSKIPIEHYWSSDTDKFYEIAKGARRINILHGFYTPHKILEENKEKIHSNVCHVSLRDSLITQIGSENKTVFHPAADFKWEDDVLSWAKHKIWVGTDSCALHTRYDDMINIPNFYIFRENAMYHHSDTIGYAARVESRKNPQYLDGLPSVAFTNQADMKDWKKQNGGNFDNCRIVKYDPRFLDNFLRSDSWGISHSCFYKEPFGYSIFQALDFGKLPILHSSWFENYEFIKNYPYRAASKEEFVTIYNRILDDDLLTRQSNFEILRYELENLVGNDKTWADQYLSLYNEK